MKESGPLSDSDRKSTMIDANIQQKYAERYRVNCECVPSNSLSSGIIMSCVVYMRNNDPMNET